jgi:hypothetical protein
MRAIAAALCFRFLAQDRARPRWLSGGDPRMNAKYRLSVLLAAPALFAFNTAVAIVTNLYESPTPKILLALLGVGGLLISNFYAYLFLGRAYDSLDENDVFPTPMARPSDSAVLAATAAGALCIAGYAFVIVLWK